MIRLPLLASLWLLLAVCSASAQVAANGGVKVVATFSILGDLVREVGGARVAVTTLVGPDDDVHVYAPSPADAKTLGTAGAVVVNGLGFEGWMTRLVQASGTKARVIVASQGVAPVQAPDEAHPGRTTIDPHAWQAVANAKIYAANIRDGLTRVDPAGAETYAANTHAYLARLDALDAEVRTALASIPPERRKIITTHDAFGYFGKAYGIDFISPESLSTDSEPSAKDVARIIGQVRSQRIPALFLENVTDPRVIEQIARETGARIGGTLYSDALSSPGGPAVTYVDMMRHNVAELTRALRR